MNNSMLLKWYAAHLFLFYFISLSNLFFVEEDFLDQIIRHVLQTCSLMSSSSLI